jgi:hypothetical protein
MGKFITGINGPIVGKVGTVVGSSRNGVPYLKGPYKKRTKRISAKEKLNRIKFAKAQAWLQPLLDIVRVGFKGYSERSEGFVAAKSHLLRNAFEGPADNRVINPALVRISHGDLPLPADITVAKTSSNLLKFTWDPKAPDGASRYDQVLLLAYEKDKPLGKPVCCKITGQFRETGSDTLKLYPKSGGSTYYIYLAFIADDRSRQSDSVYLGAIDA